MPSFTLRNVKYFEQSQVTLESFKGKWLFVYFWGLGCHGSVNSLRDIDQIQKDFRSQIQVLTIGIKRGEYNIGIEKVFDRLKKRHQFIIPVAYDTILADFFHIPYIPYIIIVNPGGIIHSITSGADLTSNKVSDLINGKTVSFHDAHPNYKSTSGFGVFDDELRRENLLVCSVLTKWEGEKPSGGTILDAYDKGYQSCEWFVAMQPLSDLYFYAYFGRNYFFYDDTAFYGKVFALPIVETENKELFQYNYSDQLGRGTYNYYLKMPKEQFTKQKVMKELQRCLDLTFGYEVIIETREMPVWKLSAGPKAPKKLKSKGGKPEFLGRNALAGVTVRNYPIRRFLLLVTSSIPNPDRLAYIDTTGIDFGIDATIETDMTDFNSIQKALETYDLKLTKSTKTMNVMVIKD